MPYSIVVESEIFVAYALLSCGGASLIEHQIQDALESDSSQTLMLKAQKIAETYTPASGSDYKVMGVRTEKKIMGFVERPKFGMSIKLG